MKAHRSALLSEPFALLCAALLLLGASMLQLEWPRTAPGDSSLGIRFSVSPGFEYEYGVFLAVLSICSALLRRTGNSISGLILASIQSTAVPNAGKSASQQGASAWHAFAIALAAGLGAALIFQPVRYDEGFTYLFFLNSHWPNLFWYPLPNNHILYSLAAKLSTMAFGQEPWAWRMPALAFSIASVVVMFRLCRKLFGPTGGYLGSVAVAMWPYLVSYSVSARGYSLAVLLTLLMVDAIAGDREKIRTVYFSFLAGLSLLVMPSMLYAISGLVCWIFCIEFLRHRSPARLFREVALPCFTLGFFFSVLLYIPVLLVNRLPFITANRFFAKLTPEAFFGSVVQHMGATWAELVRDVPTAIVVLLGVLIGAGLVDARRKGDQRITTLLPALLLGSTAFFVLKQAIPFPRTWIFLIPIFLVVADGGFTHWLEKFQGKMRVLVLAALAAGSSIFALDLARSGSILEYPDSGAAPAASAMASKIRNTAGERDWLCARVPVDVLLQYYVYEQDRGMPRPAKPGGEAVYFVAQGEFPYSASMRRSDLTEVAQVVNLKLYRFDGQISDDIGKSFHCWLRWGPPLLG